MGFESKADAREMLLALKVRLASFGLTLHKDKTRLIEFGRFAALSRWPESFAFLGFTQYCGRTLHPEAQDGRETHDAQSAGVAPDAWRPMQAPSSTSSSSPSARALWLLWQAAQSSAQRLLPRSASNLVTLSETAQSEKSVHGLAGVRPLTARFRLPLHASLAHGCRRRYNAGLLSGRAGCGKGVSRIAEWLSYSTTTGGCAELRRGQLLRSTLHSQESAGLGQQASGSFSLPSAGPPFCLRPCDAHPLRSAMEERAAQRTNTPLPALV